MQRRKRKKTLLIWSAIVCIGVLALFNILLNPREKLSAHTGNDIKTVQEAKEVNKNVDAFVEQEQDKKAEQNTEQAEKYEQQPVNRNTEEIPGLSLGKLIGSIPSKNQKIVYLTFDDGPGPYTKEMVSILNKYNIKGSFFWIGENITNELGNFGTQMIEQGHVIGSHTMHHTTLGKKDKASQKQEIQNTATYIEGKIKHPVRYFRPPYGAVNQGTREVSHELGQYLMYWQVDSLDWKLPNHPEKILENIKKEVKPGSIILMHERSQSVKILPQVIEYLQQNGYVIEPLPSVPNTVKKP
ncbi:polysaccharide deacetylase family protein [Aneurinibacillus migulanus]|uniref:polysaccharide deacetylase family protein n=1 Tax=Aneurinibacillus migulanus TaxID=47500 RepID=UPI0006A18B00|nr:polysaccharide deacetylase family protein [Aneurinibacillus migulanus]CEH30901.1 Polysaccharide deacetylase [Aneurinibacillus migulanus]